MGVPITCQLTTIKQTCRKQKCAYEIISIQEN